jgi:magnesium transporter
MQPEHEHGHGHGHGHELGHEQGNGLEEQEARAETRPIARSVRRLERREWVGDEGRRGTQLDDADVNTIVARADQMPEALADVLDTEGPAGAEPTTGEPVTTAWLFREGHEPGRVDVSEVAALAADDACFVWLGLNGYDTADLETAARELDLPEAGVRIALSGWQRPRLSVFGDRYVTALTVPYAHVDEHRVLASELDLFVGRNYLVSAHKRPLPFGERALTRAAQNPALLALDSAFLLSILCDELLTHFEDLTEGLEDEVEVMEERALTDASDEFLEDLLRLKRFVFATHRLASQHRPLLEAFLRPDFPLVGGEAIEPYFRDLEARLQRLLDALDAARDSVNGAFDLYVSRVAHHTNGIMKVLTVVSVTLLPATVILGFFGTSFEMPALTAGASFIVMLMLIGLTTAGSLLLFRRWGWLGGQTSTTIARHRAADQGSP